jgi:hypothetical protein
LLASRRDGSTVGVWALLVLLSMGDAGFIWVPGIRFLYIGRLTPWRHELTKFDCRFTDLYQGSGYLREIPREMTRHINCAPSAAPCTSVRRPSVCWSFS